MDRGFGPVFLKFCSYFPYNAKLCLNGHEYAKCQLRKEGIGFQALDNGSSAGSSAPGCRLDQKLSHHATLALAQFAVALLLQNGADEVVLCFRVFAYPCDLAAPGQQILTAPSGSFRVGQFSR
jgi:hypothetical protein